MLWAILDDPPLYGLQSFKEFFFPSLSMVSSLLTYPTVRYPNNAFLLSYNKYAITGTIYNSSRDAFFFLLRMQFCQFSGREPIGRSTIIVTNAFRLQ